MGELIVIASRGAVARAAALFCCVGRAGGGIMGRKRMIIRTVYTVTMVEKYMIILEARSQIPG